MRGTLAVPDGWQEAGGEGSGDGDAEDEDEEDGGGVFAPKSFANRASLYTQIPMFTAVVVMNLAVPGKTVEKDLLRSVDVTVSIALAVRYVDV